MAVNLVGSQVRFEPHMMDPQHPYSFGEILRVVRRWRVNDDKWVYVERVNGSGQRLVQTSDLKIISAVERLGGIA